MASAFDPADIPPAVEERTPTLQEMAIAIDRHYDAMLFGGMDFMRLLWVETQREQAHRRIANEAMQAALGGAQHRRL
jgi:hypothetical protein